MNRIYHVVECDGGIKLEWCRGWSEVYYGGVVRNKVRKKVS